MVRGDAPLPMIGTIEEFKQSLLTAKSVVYNQASTGIYLEKLFERLGIAEHLKTKTVRYPDAAAVLDHVCKGKGDEIGFGATTVIIEGESKVSNSSGHYRQKSKTTRLTPPSLPQGPLRKRRGSLSASSPGPWHRKFLQQQASNKRREHTDAFPKEILLHLVSSRCVVSLRLRLETSSRSLIGRRNGKGLCNRRKRKARSSWVSRRVPSQRKELKTVFEPQFGVDMELLTARFTTRQPDRFRIPSRSQILRRFHRGIRRL